MLAVIAIAARDAVAVQAATANTAAGSAATADAIAIIGRF
ncbi:hypothetical protein BJY16_004903 [Actinoplanes octamycinicus]|uniref:Uncharacterized protein n=1 Tax=Actinoplanes octamycinicus TaxID=135948 RepID=A0A7W7H009_9ACTN|nr:hypothetical protein [Actinoplanes octamycinicus]